MIRHAFIAATALALAAPLAAQAHSDGTAPEVAPNATMLNISTTGKASKSPDHAMFSAGVATTGKTAKEALDANSAAMNRVIRALRDSGIAQRDIQTSNLSIEPVYADRNRAASQLEQQLPPIIGYKVSNQVMVKQRDLTGFGKVIDTLVSSGANQVNGPSFQVEDVDSALDGARREAIGEARERASLYASAAGLRVKRIVSISESGGYTPRPMMARAAMDYGESAPIAAGEVEMQINLSVVFELTP